MRDVAQAEAESLQKKLRIFKHQNESKNKEEESTFQRHMQKLPIKRRFATPVQERYLLKTYFDEEFYNKERKKEILGQRNLNFGNSKEGGEDQGSKQLTDQEKKKINRERLLTLVHDQERQTRIKKLGAPIRPNVSVTITPKREHSIRDIVQKMQKSPIRSPVAATFGFNLSRPSNSQCGSRPVHTQQHGRTTGTSSFMKSFLQSNENQPDTTTADATFRNIFSKSTTRASAPRSKEMASRFQATMNMMSPNLDQSFLSSQLPSEYHSRQVKHSYRLYTQKLIEHSPSVTGIGKVHDGQVMSIQEPGERRATADEHAPQKDAGGGNGKRATTTQAKVKPSPHLFKGRVLKAPTPPLKVVTNNNAPI